MDCTTNSNHENKSLLWEKTERKCWNCENGVYLRNAATSEITCNNCHHAPPDGDGMPDYGYEVETERPRYNNSGNVVMDGVFPELNESMIVRPE